MVVAKLPRINIKIAGGEETLMKSNARNRITALVLALMLVATPMSAGAVTRVAVGDTAKEESAATQAAETTGEVVLPDLSALKAPVAPPSVAQDIGGGGEGYQYIDGMIPQSRQIEIQADSTGSLARSKTIRDTTGWAVGNVKQFFADVSSTHDVATARQFTLAAIGSHCYVFVDAQDTSGYAATFTANSYAQANVVRDKMDAIYGMFAESGGDYVGKPYYDGNPGHKIAILLYDIDSDSGASGVYTGGYFDPNDYFANTPTKNNSNEYPVLHVDIGSQNMGYYNDADLQMTFFGTIAHEFQHLINFGNYMYHHASVIYDDSDPDLAYQWVGGKPVVATWLNEGLSGVVDYIYSGAIESSHLEYFLNQDFASGVGYVPSYTGWRSASSSASILANYGAASMLMNEYLQYGGTMNAIVEDLNVGYYGSKIAVANNFSRGGFDDFFQLANLDISVDTPDGTTPPVVYQNMAVDNMWETRDGYASGDGYAGVTDFAVGSTVTVNSGGRKYYSQLFLSDASKTSMVNITIPTSSNADYFVITPYNAYGINDNAKWNDAAKQAAKLNTGSNDVIVGSNNRFAILVVNYDSAVSGQSFSTAAAQSDLTFDSVATSADPLVAGRDSQSVTVNATVLDNTLETKTLKAAVLNAEGTDVTSSFSRNTSGTNLTVTGGKVTVAYDIPASVASGSYRVRIYNDDIAVGNIIEGISPAFVLTVKVELSDPSGTNADITASDITLSFDADAAPTGSGTVSLGYSGETYSATPAASATASNKLAIPLSSFRNGSGDSPLLLYSTLYDLTVGAGVVISNEYPNAEHTFSFTTKGEPNTPTVAPKSLTMGINEKARFAVYFGQGSDVTGATVTVPDGGIVEVDETEITASGTLVTVTGKQKGTATLSIGFSGYDDQEVTVNVTGSGGTFPIVGGGGGSSSSSSGGGGGGGGYRGGSGSGWTTTNYPVTASQAKDSVAAALSKAAQDSTSITVRFTNVSVISLDIMKQMAAQAAAAKKSILVQADIVENGKVIFRLTFDPSKATKSIEVGGSPTSATASAIQQIFAKFYTNSTSVIALDQTGDYGMTVTIAALADLGKLNKETLRVVSYDRKTNSFVALANTGLRIDKNGYLTFNTNSAGSIVVTDKNFAKK